MGTEVQSNKVYLPEYNSLRDLNDSEGSIDWVLNYENGNMKSEQYGDTFSFRVPLSDEYRGYYKEELRQMILKHESTFRHQVCELHRLYKVQRDMMNEFKRKELEKYLLPAASSQKACLMPFHFLSEGDRKRKQSLNLPCDRPFAPCGNGIQSHFDSLKETKMLSCGPGKSGLRLQDCESLEPKYNTLQKSLFDLELPVNDFINKEEVGQGISIASRTKNEHLNWNIHITREKDGNLPIHCGLLSGSDADALSSNVSFGSTHGLTNMNESFQFEEASGSASVNILGTTNHLKEDMRGHDLSVTSYSGFRHLSLDLGKGKDKITGPSNWHTEAEYKQKGWSEHNLEAGRSRSNGSLCLGNSSTQDELHKAHEHPKFPLSELRQTEPQGKRKLFGVYISDRNNDASVVESHMLGPSTVVQFDASNSKPSQVSSWKNIPSIYNWNLLTAQGNPYSNAFAQSSKSSKTMMPAPAAAGGNFLVDSSSGSGPEFRSEVPYQNELIGSHWDSKKACTCQPLVGFNHACGISDRDSASERCPRNDLEVRGSFMDAKSAEAKDAVAATPNVYQMNLDFLQSHSQSISRTEVRKHPSQHCVQDTLSATHTHDDGHLKYEVGDSSGCKILGLPIYQKSMRQDLLSYNSPSKSSFVASAIDGSNSIKVQLLNTDLNHDPVSSKPEERPKVEGLMVEKGLVNHNTGLKHHIDLNLCANEDEGQLTTSCLGGDVKISGERDLVSTIIMEPKICVYHEPASMESTLKETFNSSGDESIERLEGLVKVVADTLIVISSSQMAHQGDRTCDQLEASLSDSLQWFAEIISSNKGEDIEDEVSISSFKDAACKHDSIPNGLDHFEFMTLNLTETKVEECCTFNPQVQENSEHEEKPLPRRPCRGQARRGRQRKDFQRDVLPGLAILSRNEVNDDLQIIEGMIRAAGGTWQSSLSRRNTARNTSGARGRRRMGGAANSRAAHAACLSETQQRKWGEPGLVEVKLAGWGKRTRRLPRHRCPVSNDPSNK